MIDEPPDILWEGEIQGYCLDKKKVWKLRTKLMQGVLIQTPGSLKLELSVIFGKLVDKRSIPSNEDIDLSNVTYAREKAGSKEFNFFCQCVKANEEGEDELTVHLFQTVTEEARQTWLQSVIEFMKRKIVFRPTCFFKVAVQKVHLEENVKLYGEYILRASKSEIEFMISENIPGVKFCLGEVSSIKLLQDTSLEGGKHVFDLIMTGTGTKRYQHIVVTARGGFLLLAYLQRDNAKLIEDILELRDFTQSISSLPLSPIHKRTPPVPPKPDEEEKPPLPPRVATESRGATLDCRRMRWNTDLWTTPPLPPRNDTPRSPTVSPRNSDWNNKAMTLPHKMRLNDKTSDLIPKPRTKIDIRDITVPQILPVPENTHFGRGSRGLTAREPMPNPTERSQHEKPPWKLELELEPKIEQQVTINKPKYIELKFADSPLGGIEDSPSPEDHGYATVNFPKSDSMGTPLTDLVEEIEFSKAQTDEGGYLILKGFDGSVDSSGYLTISDMHDYPTDSSVCPNGPLMTPKETQSPVVPPRTYREYLKD